MSSNVTTSSIPEDPLIVAYYSLALIIMGTLLNLLTLIVLCRPIFRDTKKQPVIFYMRAIAIFDILMLYGWNLDHYLFLVHGYILLTYSIATCKIFGFVNYFAGQTSAWLRVFICLDRYLAASRLHRTWFSRRKGILVTICSIIIVVAVFNFHFFIFACFHRPNGTINPNALSYRIYPLWDYINLGVYNCVPFVLMVAFNSGVIYHLIHRRQVQIIQNSRLPHRAISITLVITTFLFLLMTIPATIMAAFFFTTPTSNLAKIFDSALYTYHISSFPLYLITFKEFRSEFLRMINFKKNNSNVAPTITVTPHYITANEL